MNRILILMFFCFCIQVVFGQDDEKKHWYLSGYLKDMVTFNAADDSILVDNLIHNRLNFSWDASEKVKVKVEARNRLIFGDLVSAFPNYGELIDTNNDYMNLSYYGPKGKSWIFHTMIDRAYMQWYNDQWEVSVGRQRINWGVNLIWNPNDVFNSYSFFDFDYEERPGSDAIRVKRYTGFASSLEFSASVNDDFDEVVMAGMYKFNTQGYDIQLLAGKAREDLVAGVGWAGNLFDAGLKGEITYFHPYADGLLNETLLASISMDYSFPNSFYLHGSYLYNSEGSDGNIPFSLSRQDRLTARDLSPFKHSIFLQSSYAFHPLISGGMAIIYYPSVQAFYTGPNVTFSLKENLDLDLIGQLYYDDLNGDFRSQIRLFYARFKWSF